VVPAVVAQWAGRQPFAQLLSVQQALQREPEARAVGLYVGSNTLTSTTAGTRTAHSLQVTVFLRRRLADPAAFADRVAARVLAEDSRLGTQDLLGIALAYGYDIGIATAWNSQTFSHSPAQWRERLAVPAAK
jgi:hypothetical protein